MFFVFFLFSLLLTQSTRFHRRRKRASNYKQRQSPSIHHSLELYHVTRFFKASTRRENRQNLARIFSNVLLIFFLIFIVCSMEVRASCTRIATTRHEQVSRLLARSRSISHLRAPPCRAASSASSAARLLAMAARASSGEDTFNSLA